MQNEKLIIVEDEILVAKSLENMLKDYGFDVVYICDNGKDAIEKARELKPALILMDIMLKGKMDGVDAAEYVYNRLNIPVVFLTAFGDDITLGRAKMAEPYGFLLKPITDGVLKTTIEVAIQKHKLESKVRENEEWLSFILKNIDYAVLVIQSDLKVSFANPAALTLLNKSREEIINKNVKDLFMLMENDKSVVFEEMLRNIRDKNEKFEFLSRYYLISERENKIPVDGTGWNSGWNSWFASSIYRSRGMTDASGRPSLCSRAGRPANYNGTGRAEWRDRLFQFRQSRPNTQMPAQAGHVPGDRLERGGWTRSRG